MAIPSAVFTAGKGHVVFSASGPPESHVMGGPLFAVPSPPAAPAPPSPIGPPAVTLESTSPAEEEPSGPLELAGDDKHPDASHGRIASSAARCKKAPNRSIVLELHEVSSSRRV